MTRKASLSLISGTLLLASCSSAARNSLRVASTNSDTNVMVAEIYAAALERSGTPVDRRMRFGSAEIVAKALRAGDVDLYPGDVSERSQTAGEVTWLKASPANDSPCLATSQYVAEEFWMLTLSTCSQIARKLRLAATPDFVAPQGPFHFLRDFYGGFDFGKLVLCAPGTQYFTLNTGKADIINATTFDANIAEDQLIVLGDDKHFWPQHRIAPVVRTAAIQYYPHARIVLNRISKKITQYALQQMNMRRKLFYLDPYDAAGEFVAGR